MKAVDAYRAIIKDGEKPGYFAEAKLELAYFGLGDALRGQRHHAEAAIAYERAAAAKNVGTELKVRTLLAAGECHDLLGDRQQALRDYQEAIDAGPNTSRADTARKRLKSPYKAN
jgi:tetratricopeptide (TPR) repeat protein